MHKAALTFGRLDPLSHICQCEHVRVHKRDRLDLVGMGEVVEELEDVALPERRVKLPHLSGSNLHCVDLL